MKKLIIALLAAGAAVACVDKGEDIIASDIPAGYGAIRLAVDANLGLKSRAGGGSTRATSGEEWYLTKQEGVEYDRYADFVDEEGILSIPTGSEMKLHIASTDVREENYFWPLAAAADGTVEKFHADSTVAIFNGLWKQRYLLMGDYKIELAWGDADYEGPVIATDPAQQAKPYFYGINPALTVEPRVQVEVPMTVMLGSSIVRLEFTKEFESYFENGGEFEITTWTESDDEIATTAEGDNSEGSSTGDNTANGAGGENTDGGENSEVVTPVGPQPDSKFVIVFPRKSANPVEGKYEEATPFFLKNGAGRRFEISGWAIKQDPASSIKGDTVKFRNVVDLTTQTVDGKKIQGIDVEPSHADYYPKMYSYKLDVEANYVTVSVQLNAEPADSKMYVVIPDPEDEGDKDSDVEINDDARPDNGEPDDGGGTSGGGTTGDGNSGEGTSGGGTTGEGTLGEGSSGEGTTNSDETTNSSSGTTPQS